MAGAVSVDKEALLQNGGEITISGPTNSSVSTVLSFSPMRVSTVWRLAPVWTREVFDGFVPAFR
jgi:hypothetical protein